jgi:hypothetical protein
MPGNVHRSQEAGQGAGRGPGGPPHWEWIFGFAAVWLLVSGCGSSQTGVVPAIEFTRIPPASDGSPQLLETIEGRVRGAQPGQRIVLYALSGAWWVQPVTEQPFTAIEKNSNWKNSTHPGLRYAAVLVDGQYRPPLKMNDLPEKGGHVLAVATVPGVAPPVSPKTIQFSGYQWEVRQAANDPGGSLNFYDPGNAWTDESAFLHLRTKRRNGQWVSGEVKLTRSLGYGSYRFVLRDVAHLEPAVAFALFTWDDLGPSREMDVEFSRWGEPKDKNAQYVIQPYVVPANTVRFMVPPGRLNVGARWEPGRVTFETYQASKLVAEHTFTSGVPSAGNERIRMNIYVYDDKRHPLQNDSEVVIEKFEFLP